MNVDGVRQVGDVGIQVVVALGRTQGTRQRRASHLFEAAAQDLVGPRRDGTGGVGVGGPAVGRVVLEAAVAGRVVRGRDDDAVGQAGLTSPVVGQDRVADGRSRGVAIGRIDLDDNIVGGQHLERRDPCRLGQGVGVAPDEQRPGGALGGSVLDDGLRGREDVGLVERRVEAGAAMPGRAEGHLLVDVVRVGRDGVVGGHHLCHIDEVFGLCRLPGPGVRSHVPDSATRRPVAVPGRGSAVHTLR